MRVAPLVALRSLASLGPLLLLASACASSNLASTAARQCHANADCGSGQSCVYATYDSCGTPGVCVASPDGSACVDQAACGCNGATVSVCLVGGNSPTPVTALGSCDGATTQQGFDATVPAPTEDAGGSTGPGPSDAGSPSPADTGVSPPDDAGSSADAADANTTLLGMPCASSSTCQSDPVYNECKRVSGTYICTTECPVGLDSECQPPSNGVCNTSGSTNYCALQ
jgi:hypothetical protein